MDTRGPALWQVESYPDFLAARHELLAATANDFLAELRTGKSAGQAAVLDRVTVITEVADEPDERSAEVAAIVAEVLELGCAEPRSTARSRIRPTAKRLASPTPAGPRGLQPGQGKPVVLMLEPEESNRAMLQELGYEVFMSPESLKADGQRQNQEAAGSSLGPTGRDDVPDDLITSG